MLGVMYNIEEAYDIEHMLSAHADDAFTFMEWIALTRQVSLDRWVKNMRQKAIMEQFIREDPKIQPVKSALHEVKAMPVSDEEPEEKPKESTELIVSETLANIYYGQKKFQMAIDTYRKLSLVIPEKKTYFASLIKKIEKEIDQNR